MLGDLCATGRRHEHGCRRNIECLGAISTCPDDIEQIFGIFHFHLDGKFAHDLCRRGDFADRFLFDPQSDSQCRNHDRRHFSPHDAAEQRQHFIMENFPMFDTS